MTGSTVFSINLTYLRIPANPNYHMSIKKSQAILKCFVDLKFSVWFTLGSENETMFCDTYLDFFPRSSFLFPLSFFLFPLSSFPLSSFLFPDLSRRYRSDSDSRVDCRSFGVLKILTGCRPEESYKCHKHGFVF